MILDNNTAQKVLNLFPNMPYNNAMYCGVWGKDRIAFQVGVIDNNHNTIAGVYVTITEDFKIVSIERLKTCYSTGLNKMPTKVEKIPLHPLGTIPTIYL